MLKVTFECKINNLGTYTFKFLGEALNEEFRPHGYKPNKKVIKYCLLRLGSIFLPEAKSIIKQWGINVSTDNSKAKEHLEMDFRNTKETVVEMGYSLIKQVSFRLLRY